MCEAATVRRTSCRWNPVWVLSLIKLFVSQRRGAPALGHQPDLQARQSIQYTQYLLSPCASVSRLARMLAGWQGRAGHTSLLRSHPSPATNRPARVRCLYRQKGNCSLCCSAPGRINVWLIIHQCTVMLHSSLASVSIVTHVYLKDQSSILELKEIYSIWGKKTYVPVLLSATDRKTTSEGSGK